MEYSTYKREELLRMKKDLENKLKNGEGNRTILEDQILYINLERVKRGEIFL